MSSVSHISTQDTKEHSIIKQELPDIYIKNPFPALISKE